MDGQPQGVNAVLALTAAEPYAPLDRVVPASMPRLACRLFGERLFTWRSYPADWQADSGLISQANSRHPRGELVEFSFWHFLANSPHAVKQIGAQCVEAFTPR